MSKEISLKNCLKKVVDKAPWVLTTAAMGAGVYLGYEAVDRVKTLCTEVNGKFIPRVSACVGRINRFDITDNPDYEAPNYSGDEEPVLFQRTTVHSGKCGGSYPPVPGGVDCPLGEYKRIQTIIDLMEQDGRTKFETTIEKTEGDTSFEG